MTEWQNVSITFQDYDLFKGPPGIGNINFEFRDFPGSVQTVIYLA